MGRNRWAVVVAACALVVAAVAVAYAAGKANGEPVAEVVRARRFEVVDGRGRVRAVLGALPEDRVGLLVLDQDAMRRVGLAVSADGVPGLGLWHKGEQLRANLSVLDNGAPVLVLWDNGGHQRAVVAVSADGAPSVGVFAEDGKVLWKAP